MFRGVHRDAQGGVISVVSGVDAAVCSTFTCRKPVVARTGRKSTIEMR
jgi:hypothetical protein